MASNSAQLESASLSQQLQHSQGSQTSAIQQQKSSEILSQQQALNGNPVLVSQGTTNGIHGGNNAQSSTPSIANGLVTIPGITFNNPAGIASVLGHPQHLLQQQMPMFTPQTLGQIMPLQQLQVPQVPQKPSATIDTKGNSLVPPLQQPDPQLFWQQAIQSLAGGQVVQPTGFGGLSSAISQQQLHPQQFQQLISSLPMPTDLSQLALMYPLQQQTQNGVSQQPSKTQLQPTKYQVQVAQIGQDGSSAHMPNVLQSVQNGIVNVGTAAPRANKVSDDANRKPETETYSDNAKSATETKSGPSIVSFNSSCNFGFENPPERKTDTELAKMSEPERRRYERNLREQQRSYKISQQIKQLRDVLAESNIPFRPNKYSILVSVAEYIKQLQSRSIMLDAEHQRLIDTIRKTNELVSSGVAPSLSGDEDKNTTDRFTTQLQGQHSIGADLLLVQGIDYKTLFEHCPYPMGIATLDGRVLAANKGFEELLCCDQGHMIDQSLFVYIRNHQEIFEAMAALLKRSSLAVETGEGTCNDQQLLYWCGHVLSPRNQRVPLTITLTSTADNNPKFFSLSASVGSPSVD